MKELYKINGVVIKGDQRGKAMGFPTANIRLHKQVPEGIYAGSVTINGKVYISAAFVGPARTFNNTEAKVECYILNYDGNLYGRWITVRLYKKIRENKKFESVDALVDQMKKDVEKVKEFFEEEKE